VAFESSPALQRRERGGDEFSPGEPALSEAEGTEVLSHTPYRQAVDHFFRSLLVVVVVPVTMPPGKVFLLFVVRQLAKIPIGIAMGFAGPLVVIAHFSLVPDVVVAVVRVIDPVVVMLGASRAQYGRRQGGSQKK
jgi:hypothetical protein